MDETGLLIEHGYAERGPVGATPRFVSDDFNFAPLSVRWNGVTWMSVVQPPTARDVLKAEIDAFLSDPAPTFQKVKDVLTKWRAAL